MCHDTTLPLNLTRPRGPWKIKSPHPIGGNLARLCPYIPKYICTYFFVSQRNQNCTSQPYNPTTLTLLLGFKNTATLIIHILLLLVPASLLPRSLLDPLVINPQDEQVWFSLFLFISKDHCQKFFSSKPNLGVCVWHRGDAVTGARSSWGKD